MFKTTLAVVAALVAWMAVATAAGLILRLWPAYVSVAATMAFTLPMLIARLSIGAVATLVAGLVASAIAPRITLAKLLPGVILLLMFVPVHIGIWDKFPPWYHLTFLLSLVPLTIAGGTMLHRSPSQV